MTDKEFKDTGGVISPNEILVLVDEIQKEIKEGEVALEELREIGNDMSKRLRELTDENYKLKLHILNISNQLSLISKEMDEEIEEMLK